MSRPTRSSRWRSRPRRWSRRRTAANKRGRGVGFATWWRVDDRLEIPLWGCVELVSLCGTNSTRPLLHWSFVFVCARGRALRARSWSTSASIRDSLVRRRPSTVSFMPDTERAHKITTRPSHKHVRVEGSDGTVLAETDRAVELDETGLPTRFYIPRDDVRTELLESTATTSHCPFKGDATYFSAPGAKDAFWVYEQPVGGGSRAGHRPACAVARPRRGHRRRRASELDPRTLLRRSATRADERREEH